MNKQEEADDAHLGGGDQSKLVLVVDDDPAIREFIGEALHDAGYRAIFATDGPTALESLVSNHPDLVLLDVQMPGMDGWDVLSELRVAAGPNQPIVIMTGQYAGQDRALASGAQGYLAKPFNLDDLIECVDLHASLHLDRTMQEQLPLQQQHG